MTRMKEVPVSEEYLESLCEWMLEWIESPEALTISQFLAWKGIGYPYFKYFVSISAEVSNVFEIVKHRMCNRWIEKVLETDNFPRHQEKVAMRYIRLYDSHGLDVEYETRKELSKVKVETEMKYVAENYGRSNNSPGS